MNKANSDFDIAKRVTRQMAKDQGQEVQVKADPENARKSSSKAGEHAQKKNAKNTRQSCESRDSKKLSQPLQPTSSIQTKNILGLNIGIETNQALNKLGVSS